MSQEEKRPEVNDTVSNEDDFLAAFASTGPVDESLDEDFERALEALEAVERDLELPEIPADVEEAPDNKTTSSSSQSHVKREARIPPRQIIEASLFVGGKPLTTKKLCSLLNDEYSSSYVDDLLDDLNRQYNEESRPYEIRMEEGGYRLILRYDFERIRNRVFGFGPKEVKLSQDALEVLALVAYHQPITKDAIVEAGKDKAAGILRQLLRRELIAIEREEDKKVEVRYITTARFLQVFGLGNVEELPYSESLSQK
ncbi:SMC-Scp complex subunit ScpB [uncultured Gimesia sp.]|uniref:SMC-Scp complex subunit ScpB n=1 Tax=uncultured Gimesia sp. TaxID=1678688 RepID=UPI0030D8665F|tara:strand:+ start:99613 stop:100380 length:768 start_codon:yes stop_codon:yes gene_type:complete